MTNRVTQSDLVAAALTGNLVSFPTDTVPALAAQPAQAHLIYSAKQRTFDKPLILMAAEAEDLWPYVQGNEAEQNIWQALITKHWPGALTLVLPASGKHPPEMTPNNAKTLGIRVPDCAIARAILAQTGPLATTSANRSGQPALTELEAIAQTFPQAQVLQLEASDPASDPASTTDPASPPANSSDTDAARTDTALASPAPTRPSTVIAWKHDGKTPGWTLLRQGQVRLNLP